MGHDGNYRFVSVWYEISINGICMNEVGEERGGGEGAGRTVSLPIGGNRKRHR